MLENEFAVNLGLLEPFNLLADVSYLGLVADYDLPAQSLPHRSKKRPDPVLTDT